MSLYRETYLNSINDVLSYICSKTEANNSIHLFDINTHSETFYASLLNIIFDWELLNANHEEMNIVGIDLIDKQNKIAIQVTSDSSSTKIKKTIELFSQHHFYETYTTLFILIIVMNHPNYTTEFITNGLFVFNKTEHILCIKDLIKKISSLSTEKLKDLNEYLCKEVQIYQKPPTRSVLCEFIKNLSNSIDDAIPVNATNDLLPFDISEKIEYNSLKKYRTIVDDYGEYCSVCEHAFQTLAGNAKKSKTFVLHWIKDKYILVRNEVLADASTENFLSSLKENSDIIIDRLKDLIVEFLKNNSHDDLCIEEMDYCCSYFLCYAFCSCKILERPGSYDR
ncbi:SMEK domain-containing protein [Eubacterium sp.]|uniref:SMEK domain-containing protein n=1 Tax=Eubacterium sp. TaxID=142586 RepID=UPI0026DECB55|nr:SMEK domain-containing protein [Eubacterium sp.]MDO5432999.1 SMEK domain-containing protein [Eubacterium sp.]